MSEDMKDLLKYNSAQTIVRTFVSDSERRAILNMYMKPSKTISDISEELNIDRDLVMLVIGIDNGAF